MLMQQQLRMPRPRPRLRPAARALSDTVATAAASWEAPLRRALSLRPLQAWPYFARWWQRSFPHAPPPPLTARSSSTSPATSVSARRYVLPRGAPRFAAVGVVLFADAANADGGPSVLLTQRTRHIRHGGEVALPGGGFDPVRRGDASLVAAFRREAREEVGLQHLHVLGNLAPHVSSSAFWVAPVVAVHRGDAADARCVVRHVDAGEVARVLTVPLRPLLEAIDVHGRYPLPRGGHQVGPVVALQDVPVRSFVPSGRGDGSGGAVAGLVREREVPPGATEGVVWGLTGRVLLELRERLAAHEADGTRPPRDDDDERSDDDGGVYRTFHMDLLDRRLRGDGVR